MTKPPKKGPDYSREREWGVILEDLQSQFRVFGEGLQLVQDRLDRVEKKLEKLDRIESDVSIIKLIIPTLATKKELEEAIKPLATKKELKEAIEPLATKKELKEAIEPLATKKDLEVFDRRFTALESTR